MWCGFIQIFVTRDRVTNSWHVTCHTPHHTCHSYVTQHSTASFKQSYTRFDLIISPEKKNILVILKDRAETTIEGRRDVKQFVSGDTSIQLPRAPQVLTPLRLGLMTRDLLYSGSAGNLICRFVFGHEIRLGLKYYFWSHVSLNSSHTAIAIKSIPLTHHHNIQQYWIDEDRGLLWDEDKDFIMTGE